VYRRTGKRPEAQEHVSMATMLYREMDMRFWLEQAEAEGAGATSMRIGAKEVGDGT
jgi:hypothetical protein